MAFKTILVDAEREAELPGLVEAAVAIGRLSQGHVIGLAVLPARLELPGGMPGAPDPIVIDTHREAFRAEAGRMRAVFEAALRQAGLSGRWELAEPSSGRRSSALIARANEADLVITAAGDGGMKDGALTHGVSDLALKAGRPVLAIPSGAVLSWPARRILVAWNGSREATRAVFDSLPLLQAADHVKVLHLVSDSGRGDGPHPALADLASTVARHDVQAVIEEITVPAPRVAAAIVSAIKAEGADVLVMGCYGRSRWREMMLGGVSRFMLANTVIPTLLSH